MLHAGPRGPTTYVTGFVDLHRARLVDIALGAAVLWSGPGWTSGKELAGGIRRVALHPCRGFANAPLASSITPRWAWTTSTPFARPTPPWTTSVAGRNKRCSPIWGRQRDQLYGIRRLLLAGTERLGERGQVRSTAGLAAGDRFDEIGAAWTTGAPSGRVRRRRRDRCPAGAGGVNLLIEKVCTMAMASGNSITIGSGSFCAAGEMAERPAAYQRGQRPLFCIIWIAAGPITITKIAGKMQNTIGIIIFTGAF